MRPLPNKNRPGLQGANADSCYSAEDVSREKSFERKPRELLGIAIQSRSTCTWILGRLQWTPSVETEKERGQLWLAAEGFTAARISNFAEPAKRT